MNTCGVYKIIKTYKFKSFLILNILYQFETNKNVHTPFNIYLI